MSGSRFFTRKSPTQPPELSVAAQDILTGMVALAALGLAYAITHPEELRAPVSNDDTNYYLKMIDCYHSHRQWAQQLGGWGYCYPSKDHGAKLADDSQREQAAVQSTVSGQAKSSGRGSPGGRQLGGFRWRW